MKGISGVWRDTVWRRILFSDGGKVCRSCVVWRRSVVFQRKWSGYFEKSGRPMMFMVRVMCGLGLVDGMNAAELMDILGLKEAVDGLVGASGLRCCGYVLRQAGKDILVRAVVHGVDGKYRRGRLAMGWREQVGGGMKGIGLGKEDAADWCRCKRNCKSSGMHPATSIHWDI